MLIILSKQFSGIKYIDTAVAQCDTHDYPPPELSIKFCTY